MRKRPPKGVHYFHMGPWPVYCGFTTSETAFQQEMKRLGIRDITFFGRQSANATTHIFEKNGTLCFVITAEPFQPRKRTKEGYAALIAHEAIHIAQEMRRELARGEPLGDEAEAYLIQQIVQECLQIAWASKMARCTEPSA